MRSKYKLALLLGIAAIVISTVVLWLDSRENTNVIDLDPAPTASAPTVPEKVDSTIPLHENAAPSESTEVTPLEQLENTEDKARLDPESKPQIAIVIDDLGYQKESGRLLSELPYPITLAVIPDTPYADTVIHDALSSNQEVILHIPMETMEPRPWENGLTTEMNQETLQTLLHELFRRYPDAVGVNNHGGSKLTADGTRMAWVMESLADHKLYFLDSRTTHESRAIEAAIDHRVDHATRDIFLDNEKSDEAISAQFEKLKSVALRHGSAIGIGHPYPVTLENLKRWLPKLEAEGFELRFCSDLLNISQKDKTPSTSS